MKGHAKVIVVYFLMIITALTTVSCVKLFGPTDEEAVQAITATGLFSGGVEKFTLKSPIVVLEKGGRNSDGSWPVKVKMTVSFTMADGREIKPLVKTSVFNLRKTKDKSGKSVWVAL